MKRTLNPLFRLTIPVFLFLIIASINLSAQRIGEIRNLIDPNVVLVKVNGNPGVGIICGSFNGGRYILTAGHLFNSGDKKYYQLSKSERQGKKVEVSTKGSSWKTATCSYLSTNSQYDFAILAINSSVNWKKRISHPGIPRLGDLVEFFENEGNRLRLRDGKISNQTSRSSKYYFNADAIFDGASGSPVYTKQGVIGILLGTKSSKKEVLPINHMVDLLKQDRTTPNFIQLQKKNLECNAQTSYLLNTKKDKGQQVGIERKLDLLDPMGGEYCLELFIDTRCSRIATNRSCSYTVKLMEGNHTVIESWKSDPGPPYVVWETYRMKINDRNYDNLFLRIKDPNNCYQSKTKEHPNIPYIRYVTTTSE
jgi:hypothetical protein